MIKQNKKANFGIGLFGFFFIMMIVSGLFFFLSVNLHFILYDYAIQPVLDVVNTSLSISTDAETTIGSIASTYLSLTAYMDYFFGVMLLSMFITGIMSSIKARQYGLVSFFGMTTIGVLFLIFILSLALQIRGWFLNNIAYAILTTNVQMPILNFFYNYSYELAILMFLIFLGVNQLDLAVIREKFSKLFDRDKQDSEDTGSQGFNLGRGKFEE